MRSSRRAKPSLPSIGSAPLTAASYYQSLPAAISKPARLAKAWTAARCRCSESLSAPTLAAGTVGAVSPAELVAKWSAFLVTKTEDLTAAPHKRWV
jgi:hypothetical protein